MKNPKKPNLQQKKFLESKGLDPKIHKVVKNHPDFYDFYNTVTGVVFKVWR